MKTKTDKDQQLLEYAAAVAEVAATKGCFPRCVALMPNGSIQEGFYDRSAMAGVWHTGAKIACVFDERPDYMGASPEGLALMFHDVFLEEIANAEAQR